MPQAIAGVALAVGVAASNAIFGATVGIIGAGAATYAGAAIGGLIVAAGGFGATLLGGSGLLAAAGAWGAVAAVSSSIGSTPKITHPGAVIQFKADPQAGIPYMMGRAATGGTLAARMSSNDTTHQFFHSIVCKTWCGPTDSFESFKLGTAAVSFTSGAATGTFAGDLWMTQTLGPVSGWSLTQPSGTGSTPEWDASHKLTGYNAARLILKADPQKFPGGNFDTPLWVEKWVRVYDPRLDSTQTAIGGSGAQRATDETTWTWSDNPYVHAVSWILGRRQNGVLVMGIGSPPADIDIAAYVAGANVADANAWKLGGGVTSKDDKWQVLSAMLQAGGGVPLRRGGRISCLYNAPKSSVATLTTADLVGPVTRSRQQPRADRFNQVFPSCVQEAQGWPLLPTDPYKVAAYVSAEGLRGRQISYPLVQDVTQATQLGAYGIYDSHEIGPVRIQVRPKFAGVQVGETVTGYFPEIGLSADFLVLDKTFDPRTLSLIFTCRTENADKHAAALALTGTVPAAPTPTRPDPKSIPAPTGWSLTATTETLGDNTKPLIKFTGNSSDNPAASLIVFRYSKDGVTLIDIGQAAPTAAGDIRIPNPLDRETYYGHVSYRVRGVEGAILQLGPVTAGATVIPADPAIDDLSDALADLTTVVDGKNTIYFQTTEPSSPPAVANDMWVDITSGHDNASYVYHSGAWAPITDPRISTALALVATAQATADGKIQVFRQSTFPTDPPTDLGFGDLLYRTDQADRPYTWDGAAWVEITPAPAAPTGLSATVNFEILTSGVRTAQIALTFNDPSLVDRTYVIRWKTATDTVYRYEPLHDAHDNGDGTFTVTTSYVPTDAVITIGLQLISARARPGAFANVSGTVDTTDSSTAPAPITDDWGVGGVTVTADDSATSYATIQFSGAVNSTDLAKIDLIKIEQRRDGDTTWISGGTHDPTTPKLDFGSMLPQTVFDVAISYRDRFTKTYGDRLVFTDITSGVLAVPGVLPGDGSSLMSLSGSGPWTWTSTFAGTVQVDLTGASGATGDGYTLVKGDPGFPGSVSAGAPGSGGYSSKVVTVSPGTTLSGNCGVAPDVSPSSTCTGPGGLSMLADGGGDSSADAGGPIDGGGGVATGGTTNTAGSSGAGDGVSGGTVVITKIS